MPTKADVYVLRKGHSAWCRIGRDPGPGGLHEAALTASAVALVTPGSTGSVN